MRATFVLALLLLAVPAAALPVNEVYVGADPLAIYGLGPLPTDWAQGIRCQGPATLQIQRNLDGDGWDILIQRAMPPHVVGADPSNTVAWTEGCVETLGEPVAFYNVAGSPSHGFGHYREDGCELDSLQVGPFTLGGPVELRWVRYSQDTCYEPRTPFLMLLYVRPAAMV